MTAAATTGESSAAAAIAATVEHQVLLIPQQFPTIQAALDAVSGPATLVVAPEVYAESLRIIDKPYVVIQSALFARRGVTVSGAGGSAILCVERSTLHLSGIEIRSNACCRGIKAVSSSLSLQESVVAGNQVGASDGEAFGAGLHCRDSRVRLQKTAIVGNVVNAGTGASDAPAASASSSAAGGGLFFDTCHVEIAGCTVQANAVYAAHTARGGGIWCKRSTLRMWRSRVTDNALHAAACQGAGIYFNFDALGGCQLGGSVIVGNGSPRGQGGGIFVAGDASRVFVHRSTVVRQNHPTDIEFGPSELPRDLQPRSIGR